MKIETSIEVLFKKELFHLLVLLCFVFSDLLSAQSLVNNPNVFIGKGITIIDNDTVLEEKETSFSQKSFSIYITEGTSFIDTEEKVTAKVTYVNLKSTEISLSHKNNNQRVQKNVVAKDTKHDIAPKYSAKITRTNSSQNIINIFSASKAITLVPTNNTSKILAPIVGSVILKSHKKEILKIKYFYANSIKNLEKKDRLSIRPPPSFSFNLI
ncbi:hypothetical protein [Empedobacter tilapiae]|uniref:Uncharacterized protein n=1 Tax=Empedobacter tilapiae TaxID=2491114 RepID=A0A4Z1AWC5_9FLAO|nr:hypothetical protein [Empedobacter tilapiae]TGN21868.1 hypothetical protein E4J94_16840 [Empedobacter tilapiae]